MRNIRILSLALLAVGLAACENAPFRMEYGWTEDRALAYTWIPPRQESPEPAYCYRTLALPDCYQRPQPRQATRLVGFIGPEPL
jgi:hypothetical protein